MQEDFLMLTRKERDRLRVIGAIERRLIRQKEGAEELGLSVRQMRRLQKRVREEGDRGVVHRGRGRESNRKIPGEVREELRGLLRERFEDFGPTLVAEQLERLGYRVSRETVRRIQIDEGLRRPRRRERYRQRRERRACFGQLVLMDTSEHDWVEGRGEEMVLIGMIDDATSRLRARFFERDTTLANMEMIARWIKEFGRPVALYVDKASHFKVNRGTTVEEDLEGKEGETQIGRAMGELGIEVIWANSPQAKGRIERAFGTLQDRLVKGMRLAGIRTCQEANRHLEDVFLPEWERRWTVEAREKRDAHRPVERGMDLDAILSVREPRVVKNDYTIQWRGRIFQILQQCHPGGLRGGRVEVEERLDGRLAVRFKGQYLNFQELAQRPERPSPISPPKASKTWKPAPDHPWRHAPVGRARWRGRGSGDSSLPAGLPPKHAQMPIAGPQQPG